MLLVLLCLACVARADRVPLSPVDNCAKICTASDLASGNVDCSKKCRSLIINYHGEHQDHHHTNGGGSDNGQGNNNDGKRQAPAVLQYSAQVICNYTGLPADTCVACSFSGAFPPVPNVLQTPNGGYFSVVDVSTPQGALCGDWYLVYDNGNLLGPTSDPGCNSAATCTASCTTSMGCFYLTPNVQHTITIKQGSNPFNSNVVGVFVYYYGDAPPADCSNSAPTNFMCTPTPALTGQSPCDPSITNMPASAGCPLESTEL